MTDYGMGNVDMFISWANSLKCKDWPNLIIEVGTDSRSAYFEIDTNRYVSRVTFWDNGSLHMEILDTKTENAVLEKNAQALSITALTELCNEFFLLLSDSSTSKG